MEIKLPKIDDFTKDIYNLKKRIEEDKLMDTWQIKPGTGYWHRGYYFEFGMSFEYLPAGTFLQRVASLVNTAREGQFNCIWQKWIPVDPALQQYPEAFVLHDVPKDCFFWTQHLVPYEQVPSSRKLVFDRMGFDKQ